jgi:7,8-dihydropterin-6-yl-methyl-4-(beta-D-ribofuranosyl)aminobenzene 5'-phosphate synthase
MGPQTKMDAVHPNDGRAVDKCQPRKFAVLNGALALMLVGGCSSFGATASTSIPIPTSNGAPLAASTSPPDSDEAPSAAAPMPSIPVETPERMGTDMITPPPEDTLTITIIYDNNSYDPRLRTAWGFAAILEYRGATFLFDTGGDAPTLLSNMGLMGFDPAQLDFIILSHAHADHTGGLMGLLSQGIKPAVYIIPSMSAAFKGPISKATTLVEVTPGMALTDYAFTTGEMNRGVPEQALAIRTSKGLVITTGCAHPGVAEMVAQAKAFHDEPAYLVLGGYHLRGKSEAEIKSILAAFRRLGVERVAPCHCTGDQAIAMFRDEFGEDFIEAGAGRVIDLQP